MLCMELSREHLNSPSTATYESTATELNKDCSRRRVRRLPALEPRYRRRVHGADEAGAAIACAPGCELSAVICASKCFRTRRPRSTSTFAPVSPADAALIEQRILANAHRIDALTPEQHSAAGMACASWSTGRCSAHEVRPSACATPSLAEPRALRDSFPASGTSARRGARVRRCSSCKSSGRR